MLLGTCVCVLSGTHTHREKRTAGRYQLVPLETVDDDGEEPRQT